VDVIVLEGMGLPTTGSDTRSESPTDPTAPFWRVSRSNLRGDADFLKSKLRLLRRIAPRLFAPGGSTMRDDANVAAGDTALVALMRETAAATVDTVLAELRRRPIVHPEWLSLQDAAAYTGYSEQQFSEFVKRGIAPKSVLFSRNARRFKRSDVDAWCAAGGPSAYACKDEPGAVLP
jgi:predicted DNA-binding transcriptional regulator AlpA